MENELGENKEVVFEENKTKLSNPESISEFPVQNAKNPVEVKAPEIQKEEKPATFKCCICKKISVGYGNNPAPIKKKGRCCDKCNSKVLKKRVKIIEGWK